MDAKQIDFNRELDTYVDNTLYPAINDRLNELFPNLNFRLNSSGYWYSDTTLSGEKKKGKTVLFAKYAGGRLSIGANNPEEAGISKYAPGARGIDVIKLYRALYGNPTYTEAVKRIAEELNVSLAGYPKGSYTYDTRPAEDKELAKEAFIKALKENTPEAAAALDFLHKKGYTDKEIEAAGIGLATPKVIAALEKSAPYWYPREAEGKTAKAQGIGDTWKIAVPMYYGSKVDSFNFRTVGAPPEGMPKYKVPAGIKRDIFSGLTVGPRESLILVEGELDALKARINGVPNVVSYGMNYIGSEKVKNAVARGFTKYTIIPDNDKKEGVRATDQPGVKNIVQSIDNLYNNGATEVYIAPLIDENAEAKDTEEYIATYGVKKWKETISQNKISAVAFLVNRAFIKAAEEATEKGVFNPEDRAALLTELEGILTAPRYDKYSYREEAYAQIGYFLNQEGGAAYNFTLEGLKSYVEQKRERVEREKRIAAYKRDLTEAAAKAQAGEIDIYEADSIIADSRKKNIARNNEAEAAAIFWHPTTVEEAENEIRKLPEGVRTGLYLLNEAGDEVQEITLKEGVSLLVGARKHGKTTILCNMALNAAAENIRRYREGIESSLKKVLFVSYEVTYARLLQKLLSIFLNDPRISNNSARTILSYYKGKGAQYFNGEEEGEGYKDFLKNKDAFFTDYINSGALTIITADKVLERANKKLTVENLVAYAEAFLRNNSVSLLALDYIQEIYTEKKYGTRVEELKYIGEVLRDFANGEKLPILCAAQFNRQIQSLIDLITSNIGEAGDLERNGIDVISAFNLKELGRIRGNKSPIADILDNADILHRYGLDNCIDKSGKNLDAPRELTEAIEKAKDNITLKAIPGKMYIRLIASRYEDFPADVVADFNGATGYIDIPGTKAAAEAASRQILREKAKSGNTQETNETRRELEKQKKELEKKLKKYNKELETLETAANKAELEAISAEDNKGVKKALQIFGSGEEVKRAEDVAKQKRETATKTKGVVDSKKQAIKETAAEINTIEEKLKALEDTGKAQGTGAQQNNILIYYGNEETPENKDSNDNGQKDDLPF